MKHKVRVQARPQARVALRFRRVPRPLAGALLLPLPGRRCWDWSHSLCLSFLICKMGIAWVSPQSQPQGRLTETVTYAKRAQMWTPSHVPQPITHDDPRPEPRTSWAA